MCVVCVFTENQDYLLTDMQRLRQRLPTVSSKLMEMFLRFSLPLKLPVQAESPIPSMCFGLAIIFL